jgi:hypothetical protein
MEQAMSDVPPLSPEELLRDRLRQAEVERRQAEEDRRLQQERLRPYQELRPRWERAWEVAYLWPGQQRRRGRKPDPQGFEEWAGLWVELGAVLNAFNRILRDREEHYRAMAGPVRESGPEPPSLCPLARLGRAADSGVPALDAAALLLLIGCEGERDRVANQLACLNRDPELCRFVLWLPFIRDALWHPDPDENGLTRTAEPPDDVSFADFLRANAAFGRRGSFFTPPENGEGAPPPDEPGTPALLLARVEAARDQTLRRAAETGPTARGVRADTREQQLAWLRGQLEGDYLLPQVEPLWMDAAALGLRTLPPFRGEPRTGPEAIQALDELARCIQAEMVTAPPPEDEPGGTDTGLIAVDEEMSDPVQPLRSLVADLRAGLLSPEDESPLTAALARARGLVGPAIPSTWLAPRLEMFKNAVAYALAAGANVSEYNYALQTLDRLLEELQPASAGRIEWNPDRVRPEAAYRCALALRESLRPTLGAADEARHQHNAGIWLRQLALELDPDGADVAGQSPFRGPPAIRRALDDLRAVCRELPTRRNCPEEVTNLVGFLDRALERLGTALNLSPLTPQQRTQDEARAVVPALAPLEEQKAHPDGLEGGCWLWWKGQRHDVPKGVVYRLLAHMWNRDSASYDSLDGPVFEGGFLPGTLRGRVSEVNKVLKRILIPWKLATDSDNRILTKQPYPID